MSAPSPLAFDIAGQNHYAGRWQPPLSGRTAEIIEPATGRAMGRAAKSGAGDVDAAVASARGAFAGWRDTAPLQRADLLREMARALRRHAGPLAEADARNSGGLLPVMVRDVETSARTLEFFAGLVTELKGETVPMGPGNLNYTLREPWGVIGCVLAFNHPLLFAVGRTAPALAAGNTVVVKPADRTPVSALMMAGLWESILPPGVFNVVVGDRDCGAALSAHPGLDRSSLVGSVATGKAMLHAAADHVRPAALELGGKNAMIVRPDADPDAVVTNAVAGMNLALAGQSCGAISRLFLHESVHDDLLARITSAVARIRPGLPEDPDAQMGALISAEHKARVERFVDGARSEGAVIETGGTAIADPALAGGHYVAPVVLSGVTTDMTVAREEVFGPVLSVLRWSDEDEVIAQANGLDYGLTAAVFTRDLEAAHRFARRLEAGFVWVNQVGHHFLGAPFGGMKQSGLGREECLEELLACTQVKNVNIRFADG